MDRFSPDNTITLGLVQMSMTEEPKQNLDRAIAGIREAASRGADIICLPELFRSPYFCTQEKCPREYAEAIPGETGAALSAVAAECGVAVVGGSVYEQGETAKLNTALVYDQKGSLLGEYRKTHIPHDPAFYEQHYFSSGGSNYRIFELKIRNAVVKIGVLICYDQWFPEAARSLALLGADIVFYPTAIGTVKGVTESEGSWHDAWQTVQRGHAVANSMIVAAVNRVGTEGDSVFWGGSFVSDAFGRILAEGTNREEIVIAPVQLDHSRFVRESWRFFKERRPDTYELVVKPVTK